LSIEMQMAPWLLPSMHCRYRGRAAPVTELRVFDARDIPAGIAAGRTVRDEVIAEARCTWIEPGRAPTGTIVFLHGGGYVFGPGPGHWDWLAAMCDATGMAGLLVRYARAPESPYPEALQQVLAVCEQMAGEWVLAGDSAGAGLALAATMRLRDGGRPLPRSLVLSSPWLDLTMSNPDLLRNRDIDVMLGIDRLADYARQYADATDMRDPGISPGFGDPDGLPPMIITVGGAELMLWEIRDWKARCDDVRTPCELIEVPGAIHDFAMARTLFPEARQVLPRLAAFAARE
jgi:acetyl esterase/lipase